jgi:hypothetical protein
MNFIKFPFQGLRIGAVVEVTLTGVESDVFLVDPSNLRSMEAGGQFKYHGGHFKNSPVRISVPSEGDWTAIVVPGAGGTVNASARVVQLL